MLVVVIPKEGCTHGCAYPSLKKNKWSQDHEYGSTFSCRQDRTVFQKKFHLGAILAPLFSVFLGMTPTFLELDSSNFIL